MFAAASTFKVTAATITVAYGHCCYCHCNRSHRHYRYYCRHRFYHCHRRHRLYHCNQRHRYNQFLSFTCIPFFESLAIFCFNKDIYSFIDSFFFSRDAVNIFTEIYLQKKVNVSPGIRTLPNWNLFLIYRCIFILHSTHGTSRSEICNMKERSEDYESWTLPDKMAVQKKNWSTFLGGEGDWIKRRKNGWLVSLFDGISTFVGCLMQKPSLEKNSRGPAI